MLKPWLVRRSICGNEVTTSSVKISFSMTLGKPITVVKLRRAADMPPKDR
jgi:hypothetical protein